MPSEEREKPEGGAEDDAKPAKGAGEGEERPTVAPPFDPVEFAKEILEGPQTSPPASDKLPGSALPSPPPPPRSLGGPFSPGALQGPASNAHTRVTPPGGFRPPAPTDTDSAALEEARKRSLEMMERKATPTGALSYVNTTIPTNVPPPPVTKPSGGIGGPQRSESTSSLNAVDAEWSDLEASTRPPPAGQNPEDFDIPSRREPGGTSSLEALARAELGNAMIANAGPVAMPTDREEPPPSGKKTTPPPANVEDPAFLREAKRKSVRQDVPPTEEEMNDRVSLGDYTGALAIAEKLLATDPGNPSVNAVADNCRTVLRQMYITKIGPMDRVPMVMVPRDQLRWLSIDHRAGFVLSLVDGVSSIEMILDVSGMPELDALRILTELAQQRIISFR